MKMKSYLSRAKQRKVIVMGDNKIEQYVSNHIYKRAQPKQKQKNTDILAEAEQLDKDRMVVLLNIVLRQFKQNQNKIYGNNDFVHDGISVIDISYSGDNGSQANIRIPIILSNADAGAVLTDDNASSAEIAIANEIQSNSNANIPVMSSRVHLKEVEEIDKIRGSRDMWLLGKMAEYSYAYIHSKNMLRNTGNDSLGSRDVNENITSSLEINNQDKMLLLSKNVGTNINDVVNRNSMSNTINEEEQKSRITVEIKAIKESLDPKKDENDIESNALEGDLASEAESEDVVGFKSKNILNKNRVVIDLMPYYTDSVYIGDLVLDSANGNMLRLRISYFQYRVREINLNNIGYLKDYLEQSIIVNNRRNNVDEEAESHTFILDFAWVSYMQLDAVIELKKLLVMNQVNSFKGNHGIDRECMTSVCKNQPNTSHVETSKERGIEAQNKAGEIIGNTCHIAYKDIVLGLGYGDRFYSDYRFKILNHEVVILNCNKMIQSLLFDFD